MSLEVLDSQEPYNRRKSGDKQIILSMAVQGGSFCMRVVEFVATRWLAADDVQSICLRTAIVIPLELRRKFIPNTSLLATTRSLRF